ncbi:MAG: hypothetical protein IPG39_11945 [Bacteroidetes bacterium]|nr:hypothetical protein [Bacteroidota bacterium]
MPKTIYYSIIDMTLNGGLGAVISKNIISNGVYAVGISICKHANGRDGGLLLYRILEPLYINFYLPKIR